MNKIQWEHQVSIFENPFILKELGIAIGIPFGLLIAAIIIFSKGNIMNSDAKYALFMIGLLFFFTFLFVLILNKGKYAPGFIINNEGILNYTQEDQGKQNKIINTLAFIFGLLSRNLSVSGAGLLAQSKQVEQIKWKDLRKTKYFPKKYTILVYGSFTQKIALFCTKENYSLVERMIKEKTR